MRGDGLGGAGAAAKAPWRRIVHYGSGPVTSGEPSHSRHPAAGLRDGEVEDRSSSSSLRLSLAPIGPAPALLDDAWWPRARDLGAELPALTAVLDPLWGRITRVTVNPTHWPAVPRKVPVAGHAVNVGCFLAEQNPHELLLFSYHMGRWNLLVIPPRTAPVSAAWLTAAASDPWARRPRADRWRRRRACGRCPRATGPWRRSGTPKEDMRPRSGRTSRASTDPARHRHAAVSADGEVRTTHTFATMVVLLSMVGPAVLLVHLLDSQHSDRVAAFLPTLPESSPGTGPSRP
jgi:hypothetical protein